MNKSSKPERKLSSTPRPKPMSPPGGFGKRRRYPDGGKVKKSS